MARIMLHGGGAVRMGSNNDTALPTVSCVWTVTTRTRCVNRDCEVQVGLHSNAVGYYTAQVTELAARAGSLTQK